MTKDYTNLGETVKNIGWRITFAGIGINLALGILHTWSVFSKEIPDKWGWTEADRSLPYAIACLVFSIIMVPGGRVQDKTGPRFTATIGGLLVGIGLILASFTTTPLGYIFGFGVLAGSGIAFGYASLTPAAVKWFPPSRTGLIAGMVLSGFGLASIYLAPLSKYLINTYGLASAMLILGIAILIVVVTLSQFLKTPPEGYIPAETGKMAEAFSKRKDFSPGEMLSTRQFFLLWVMYAFSSGAGMMIISKLAKIAKEQFLIDRGFVFVAVLALGSGSGRIIAGAVSDKLGRNITMFICFIFQSIMMLLLSITTPGSILANKWSLALMSVCIGGNYGANLSLFPAITKDYYGLKNFGMNYGLIFTATGVGGFFLPIAAGKLYDMYHTFNYAYYIAASLLIIASILTFFAKEPKASEASG